MHQKDENKILSICTKLGKVLVIFIKPLKRKKQNCEAEITPNVQRLRFNKRKQKIISPRTFFDFSCASAESMKNLMVMKRNTAAAARARTAAKRRKQRERTDEDRESENQN